MTAYLRQQHRAACLTAAQPVSVVPPVSLLKPYSLPVASRPLNAPANVTLRLSRQQVWGGFGGRGERVAAWWWWRWWDAVGGGFAETLRTTRRTGHCWQFTEHILYPLSLIKGPKHRQASSMCLPPSLRHPTPTVCNCLCVTHCHVCEAFSPSPTQPVYCDCLCTPQAHSLHSCV